MENPVWTPDLVEELMFRQFIKNEDISRLLPPPPGVSQENYLERYEQATKILFTYVRNGPIAALSSQNVNTASNRPFFSPTPSKAGLIGRTPNVKTAADAPRAPQPRTPTPKLSRAPSVTVKGTASPAMPQRAKRAKVEWPADVPTNNALKSNSRSKVAHLTARRVAAQGGVDPDLIFSQNPGDLPLHVIFEGFPKALKSISATRNASGDWRTDTFAPEEEQLYKRELSFKYVGPSQCMYGRLPPPPS